ncbi:MAG: hypothetical protein PHY44_03940 [Lachnospiraceae bacterium]|nr:hypothetical protein [Lachnospiraceae bacterium]
MAQVNIDVAKEASVQGVNTKVGTSSDTASNTPTTIFAGIKGLISWFTSVWTAARATKLDSIQTTLNTPDGNTLGAWLNYMQSTSQSSVNLLNDGSYGLNAIKTSLAGGVFIIKSIQRLHVSYGDRTLYIATVNPSKTIVLISGGYDSGSGLKVPYMEGLAANYVTLTELGRASIQVVEFY